MGYIGRAVAVGQTETVKDSFNGDNSTVAFTMSQSVSLDTDIEVFVGNVQQELVLVKHILYLVQL